MENFKINLDRPKISSEEINANQNFDNVLSKFNQVKAPAYKNPWFWGSAGLATVGLTTIVSLSALTLKNETDDKKITLKNNQLPADTECVKPPVKGENVDYKTYQVDPNKDEKIVLTSGTTIEIDKGSLQAQNPNEKVNIKVREFNDAASVFVSGIPMDYKKDAFESAGMIEIKGEQNGKEVAINPEKPIEVDLVTTKNPETFGFWYLNENNKAWESYPAENLSQNTSNVSSKSVAALKNDIKQTDVEIKTVETKISNLEKPSSEAYKIPKKSSQQFDLDFDKNEYPELASFKNVIFEVVSNNGNDPNFAKNSKKTWSEIDLKKKNEAYFAYFKSSNDSYTIQVRPILQGSELKNAEQKFDLALQNFQTTKSNLEQDKKTLVSKQQQNQMALDQMIKNQLKAQDAINNERRVVNQQTMANLNGINKEIVDFSATLSFQTTKWGFFNCDKQVAYPEPLTNGVALIWLGDRIAKFKQLFVFNKDKNLRFTYGEGSRDIELLGFPKNDDLVLIGIDFEGNIGYAEIKKSEEIKNFKRITFSAKGKETKTVDLLKKLLDETVDMV